jgi:hypothetical protein
MRDDTQHAGEDAVEGVIPGVAGAETVASGPEFAETLRANAETIDSDPNMDQAPAKAPRGNWKDRLERDLRKHEAEREDLGAASDAPLVASARYRVVRELGRGGMGAVLEAEDRVLGRQVALKVLLRGDSAQGRTRFASEARVASQLEHPNIVPVYDMGSESDEGSAYLAMRLVRGDPRFVALLAKMKKRSPDFKVQPHQGHDH